MTDDIEEWVRSREAERQAMIWSIDKQRRSSVDWHAVVPGKVADDQIRYERSCTALAMKQAGFTYDDIALRYGVSRERICQRVRRAQSEKLSPVEVWLKLTPLVFTYDDDCSSFRRRNGLRGVSAVLSEMVAFNSSPPCDINIAS